MQQDPGSPPVSPFHGPANTHEHHRRDYSAISALTEASVEETEEEQPEGLATVPSDASFHQEPLLSQSRTSATDKLKLVDLNEAGPLESEAETSILKALEEKEEERGARPQSGSNILHHIPDEGIDSLLDHNNKSTEEKRASQKDDKTTTCSKEPTRRRSTVIMPPANESLETELAGLTSAMQDIRQESGDETPVANRGILHSGFTRPHSLVHNAELVFNKSLKRRKGTRKLQTNMFHRRGDSSTASGYRLSRQDEADVEVGEGATTNDDAGDEENRRGSVRRKKRAWLCKRGVKPVDNGVEYTGFKAFLRQKWGHIRLYLLIVIFYIILPLLGFSALFFNLGNPSMRNRETTISYMFNFVVRQIVTFSLSLATQLVLLDLIAVRTPFIVRVFGQIFTLVLIQSHGLPFLVFFWSLYSSAMTTGNNEFAKHWLFWQNKLVMFTAANNDGGITTEEAYHSVLNAALIFGVAVLVKRVLLGVYIGKRTYLRYGDQLAEVMRQMLLVSEVARLAQGIEAGLSRQDLGYRKSSVSFSIPPSVDPSGHSGGKDDDDSVTLMNVSSESNVDNELMFQATKLSSMTGSIRMTQRMKILELLGEFEEPAKNRKEQTRVSIRSVLQFRQALKLTDVDYPFSTAFGLANSRESCIESSQKVYVRLLSSNSSDSPLLDFQTIAVVATREDGSVDEDKMKELLRLFRPDREGKLSMLDFVRSIDGVYKSMRLLRASVENSGQIDRVFEIIINVCFYILLFVILVAVMGLNPLSLILSISSLIVAFSFAIGGASSKAVEGILFILLRRPYDIGDRIHVSPVDEDTNKDGSSSWFVEKVDLFSTTIRYATTNEVATATNGSMANSRIINAARSKNPVVYVYMRFGVDVPYRKVKIFKATVEDFVRQRPRQWMAMNGFRATKVEQDLGFIEYVIVLQHRGTWQQVGSILNSKAEFSSFSLEVAKKLDMRYKPPGLSVDVSMAGTNDSGRADASETGTTRVLPEMDEVAALFSKAKG